MYLSVTFHPEATRTYTYHYDGDELIAPGDQVLVPTSGDGMRTVTVSEIDLPAPEFDTKPVTLPEPAEDGGES